MCCLHILMNYIKCDNCCRLIVDQSKVNKTYVAVRHMTKVILFLPIGLHSAVLCASVIACGNDVSRSFPSCVHWVTMHISHCLENVLILVETDVCCVSVHSGWHRLTTCYQTCISPTILMTLRRQANAALKTQMTRLNRLIRYSQSDQFKETDHEFLCYIWAVLLAAVCRHSYKFAIWSWLVCYYFIYKVFTENVLG